MEIANFIRKHILDVKPYVPGRPIREEENVLKLASNENLLGVPESVRNAILHAIDEINLYPDDSAFFLKKKLSEYYGVPEDWIMPVAGAVEAIYYVSQIFLDPGDEMIMSNPGFPIFHIVGAIQNAKRIMVDVDENFVARTDEMASRITDKTKLIWLDNPNNPCGTIVERKAVLDLLRKIDRRCFLVYDEAYVDFVEPEADFVNGLELIKDFENVISLRTFSKIFGLAGIRAGTILARPEVISALMKVRIPFNVNALAQKCLMSALDDREFYEKSISTNARMRKLICELLSARGFRFIPSHTNFVLFDSSVDSMELAQEMGERGVFVRPMKGIGLANWVRASFPASEKDAHRFVDVLAESVEKIKAKTKRQAV